MDCSENESELGQLVEAFLCRENANTAQNYASAIEDFRRFTRAPTGPTAIARLTSAGPVKANAWVGRYKKSMTGQRDSRGNLIKGRGLSSAAVNLRLTVLRSVIKKARRAGLIDWELDISNIGDERVHDVRGPALGILNEMLAAAKRRAGAAGVRDYAILRLAAELGLRRRELIGLDLHDVDLVKNELKILGKGRREKETLSFTPQTGSALQSWLRERPETGRDSPLFTNLIPGRASRLSGPAVYLIVRGLGAEVLPTNSKQRISPHRIRHSAITSAVRLAKANGLAREEVQKFSRHKDFRMVARYLDADDRAQEILAKANGARLA